MSKAMSEKHTCCETVGRGTGWHKTYAYCGKTAKFERDGKFYCGTHDPVRRQDKINAQQAIWAAERQANTKAERLRSAAPDMIEALQAVLPFMIPGMNWTCDVGQLIEGMVKAAIAKAEGTTP